MSDISNPVIVGLEFVDAPRVHVELIIALAEQKTCPVPVDPLNIMVN
jgi:hypothetical protein